MKEYDTLLILLYSTLKQNHFKFLNTPMKQNSFFFSIFLALFALTSCEETAVENKIPVVANTVENLPADPTTGVDPITGRPSSSGVPTYFSLRENRVIPEAEKNTTNWDIAFQATNLFTNGGISGPGEGGAHVATGIFSEIKSIDASVPFAQDAQGALAIPAGSGNGWYTYIPQNNSIMPIAGRVLFIRTADGKYAKLEILSYYKDSPTTIDASSVSRHYTFRYVFQPDGSRSFE